jgi:hypothetical protein
MNTQLQTTKLSELMHPTNNFRVTLGESPVECLRYTIDIPLEDFHKRLIQLENKYAKLQKQVKKS